MLTDVYKNMLNEAHGKPPEIDSEIKDVLHRYDFPYLSSNTDIVSIKITDKEGTFAVTRVNKKGKETTQLVRKLGGLLVDLLPGVDVTGDPTVQKMINELRTISNKIELKEDFEVHDNIIDWYKKLKKIDKHAFHSCVTGREQLLESLEKDPNIQIVIMKDKKTGKPKGRALLWKKVQNSETKEANSYLERCYPNNDEYIKNEYTKWAKLKGYWYRTYQGASTENISNISGSEMKIRFMFTTPYKKIKFLPYMDTFRNVWIFNNKRIIVTNYKTKSSKWWSDNERGINLKSPGKVAKDFRKINGWVDDRNDEEVSIGNCYWCNNNINENEHYIEAFNIDTRNSEPTIHLMCYSCYDDICFNCEYCGNNWFVNNRKIVNKHKPDVFFICPSCLKNRTDLDIITCQWCRRLYTKNNLLITDKQHYVCSYCVGIGGSRNMITIIKCDDCGDIIEYDQRSKINKNIHLKVNPITFNSVYLCNKCLKKDEYTNFESV